MGSFSLTRCLVVLAVVLIFGVGCLPQGMGELTRGMRALDDASTEPAGERPVEAQPVTGSPR